MLRSALALILITAPTLLFAPPPIEGPEDPGATSGQPSDNPYASWLVPTAPPFTLERLRSAASADEAQDILHQAFPDESPRGAHFSRFNRWLSRIDHRDLEDVPPGTLAALFRRASLRNLDRLYESLRSDGARDESSDDFLVVLLLSRVMVAAQQHQDTRMRGLSFVPGISLASNAPIWALAYAVESAAGGLADVFSENIGTFFGLFAVTVAVEVTGRYLLLKFRRAVNARVPMPSLDELRRELERLGFATDSIASEREVVAACRVWLARFPVARDNN